ncbi:hypothetical protein [Streptacidiphilus melanogenes]|uniref:hypothetical protein n=1 Tax=Streptacidiphilus melanogenes TaxID=411235 RepID=UPI001269E509|nr:hypothetical protein [Streptacidiphilus melanogenes]
MPALGFAGSLVGCGVVFAAFRPQHNPQVGGCQFEPASRLPEHEHAVRLVPTEGTASFVGVFQGTLLDRQRQLFHVGGSKFPADRYRIDLLRWPDERADLEANRKYSHPLEIPDGLDGLLPGPAVDFCGFSALHCVIVGSGVRTEQEAQTIVAASFSSPAVPLGSLLRPRAVRDTGRQYRSLILSAREDPEEYRALVAGRHPSAVVLDGAAAVCRWLGANMAPVTVALVERLGASGEAAADLLESRRGRSLCDLPLPSDLAEVPSGIEVLAWQDRG